MFHFIFYLFFIHSKVQASTKENTLFGPWSNWTELKTAEGSMKIFIFMNEWNYCNLNCYFFNFFLNPFFFQSSFYSMQFSIIEPSIIQNLNITLHGGLNSSYKDGLMTWKEPQHVNGIIQKYLVSAI